MWSHTLYIFILFLQDVKMTVIITAYDRTAISQQEPLTMICNYAKDPTDFIIGFNWFHDATLIAAGTISPKTAVFQPSSYWSAGVFLGDFVSSLTIQLPAFNVTSSVAGNYTCKLSTLYRSVQDSAIATILETQMLSGFPSIYKQIELSNLSIDCRSYINEDTPTPPSFTWTHKGEVVSSSSILSVPNIQQSEGGNYTCTVNSTTGLASATVEVLVETCPIIYKADRFWTGVGVGIVIALFTGLIVALVCVVRNNKASAKDDGTPPPVTSRQSDRTSKDVFNIRL